MKTTTIVAISVGTVVTGMLAYAVYFDHRRRTDPDFRKSLKKEARKQARMAKEEEEAQGHQQRAAIVNAVDKANAEGFPEDLEAKEAFFMSEVARGEGMCADGSDPVEAALCFYKALKVYPQPKDLIGIYDKTVPKEILEILAEMIAQDDNLKVGSFGGDGSGSEGHGVE